MCWHTYGLWQLVQDNRCEGNALLEKTCTKCGNIKRRTTIYVPVHNWTPWIHVGTLKRHFYGEDKNTTLILNRIIEKTCTLCKITKRNFV